MVDGRESHNSWLPNHNADKKRVDGFGLLNFNSLQEKVNAEFVDCVENERKIKEFQNYIKTVDLHSQTLLTSISFFLKFSGLNNSVDIEKYVSILNTYYSIKIGKPYESPYLSNSERLYGFLKDAQLIQNQPKDKHTDKKSRHDNKELNPAQKLDLLKKDCKNSMSSLITNNSASHPDLQGNWTWYHKMVFNIFEKMVDKCKNDPALDNVFLSMQERLLSFMSFFNANKESVMKGDKNISDSLLAVQHITEGLNSPDIISFFQNPTLNSNFFGEFTGKTTSDSRFLNDKFLIYGDKDSLNDDGINYKFLSKEFGGNNNDMLINKINGIKRFFKGNFGYLHPQSIDFDAFFEKNKEKLMKENGDLSVIEQMSKALEYWAGYNQNINSITIFKVLLDPKYGLVDESEGKKMFLDFYDATFKTKSVLFKNVVNSMSYNDFFGIITNFQNNDVLYGILQLEKTLALKDRKKMLAQIDNLKISFDNKLEIQSSQKIFDLMFDQFPELADFKTEFYNKVSTKLAVNRRKNRNVVEQYFHQSSPLVSENELREKIKSSIKEKLRRGSKNQGMNHDDIDSAVNFLLAKSEKKSLNDSSEVGESKPLINEIFDESFDSLRKDGKNISDLPMIFCSNLIVKVEQSSISPEMKVILKNIYNPQKFSNDDIEAFLKFFSEKKDAFVENKSLDIAADNITEKMKGADAATLKAYKDMDKDVLIQMELEIMKMQKSGQKDIDYEKLKSNVVGTKVFMDINFLLHRYPDYENKLIAALKSQNPPIQLADYMKKIKTKLENNGAKTLDDLKQYFYEDKEFAILHESGILKEMNIDFDSKVKAVNYYVEYIKGTSIKDAKLKDEKAIAKQDAAIKEISDVQNIWANKPIEQQIQEFKEGTKRYEYNQETGKIKCHDKKDEKLVDKSVLEVHNPVQTPINTMPISGLENLSNERLYMPSSFAYTNEGYNTVLQMDGEKFTGVDNVDVNKKAVQSLLQKNGFDLFDIEWDDDFADMAKFGFDFSLPLNQEITDSLSNKKETNLNKFMKFLGKYLYDKIRQKLEKENALDEQKNNEKKVDIKRFTKKRAFESLFKNMMYNPSVGLKNIFEYIKNEPNLAAELGLWTGESNKISLKKIDISLGYSDFDVDKFYQQKAKSIQIDGKIF